MASIRAALDRTRYKDEHQLPLARLDTELRLAQEGPAEALAVVEDALDRFDVLRSPRYAWPLLVAGARASAPAAAAGDRALLPRAAALRDRLRAAAGKLAAEGLAQQAHQLTFAAETMTRRPRAGSPADTGGPRLGRGGAGLGGRGPALPAGRMALLPGGRGGAERRRPRRGRRPGCAGPARWPGTWAPGR